MSLQMRQNLEGYLEHDKPQGMKGKRAAKQRSESTGAAQKPAAKTARWARSNERRSCKPEKQVKRKNPDAAEPTGTAERDGE